MEIYLQLQLIARNAAIHKAQILGQDLVEDETAHGGLDDIGQLCSVRQLLAHAHLNAGLKLDDAILVSENRFVYILKGLALSDAARALLGQVVDT